MKKFVAGMRNGEVLFGASYGDHAVFTTKPVNKVSKKVLAKARAKERASDKLAAWLDRAG